MKFTILINQLAWSHYYPKAKLQHATIFEAIKGLCNSTSTKMIRTADGYTYVATNKILEEMPLLNLKSKGAVTPIIQRLKDWKLIDYKQIDRKNYYKLTEESEKLERSSSENEQVFKKMNEGVQKNEQQVFKKMNGSYNHSLSDNQDNNTAPQTGTDNPADKPKQKSAKNPDSRVKEIHDFYLKNHPLCENYIPDFPKERKIIKNLIAKLDVSRKSPKVITERLNNYFKSGFYQATGWALESFVKNFNAFVRPQKDRGQDDYIEPIKPHVGFRERTQVC